MSYTVLARKYRSRSFDDVIGQEPIATTLTNAIKSGRIHHGYLFTGTRGVGKTSMARILAKALNCLGADAPTATPCCKCEACVAIGEGQDIDVVEIDAASNTGVDNIRELRSNTAYRPARSRFKIYIIDEVHMLSTGAFNALLKTLEEPPGHVKFILATTELQKVPATIQSRCQKFQFRNIAPDAVAERLAAICKQEGARAEPAVLRRVARLANGSMRDALSILDQLLSVTADEVTLPLLDELLPPPQDEQVLALLTRAADGDAAGVLAVLDRLLSGGRGLDVFCGDLIEVARSLMLVRVCGADAPIVDLPAAARDDYVALAQRFDVSQYVQMIAMLEELRRNVRFSAAGRALTDALLVRLAHLRSWSSIEQLLGRVETGAAAPVDPSEKKKPPLTPLPDAGRAKLVSVETPAPPAGIATLGAAPPAAVAPTSAPPVRRTAPAPLTPPPAAAPAPLAPGAAPAQSSRGVAGANGSSAQDRGPAPAPLAASAPPSGASSIGPSVPRPAPEPRVLASASAEERDVVLTDPLVRQAIELFDGVVVDIRKGRAAARDAGAPLESAE